MLIMALWFFGQLQAPKDKDFAYSEFGQLPVVFDGRLKPMDSLARNSLLSLRDKQTMNLEPWKEWYQHPKIISASEWLANVMMNPAVADNWPVFRVDNPDLISLLKLPERDVVRHVDGKQYSWNQIAPALDVFKSENENIETNTQPQDRTAYQNAVVKMQQRLFLYAQLKNTAQPADAQDWPAELAAFEKFMPDGVAAVKAQQAGEKFDQQAFSQFADFVQAFQYMSNLNPPLILPPAGSTEWRRMGDALLDLPRGAAADGAMNDYVKMAGALTADQPDAFNAALHDYRSLLVPTQAKALAKTRAEVFFNQM